MRAATKIRRGRTTSLEHSPQRIEAWGSTEDRAVASKTCSSSEEFPTPRFHPKTQSQRVTPVTHNSTVGIFYLHAVFV